MNLVRFFAAVSAPIIPETSAGILSAFLPTGQVDAWPSGAIAAELQRITPGQRVPVLDLLFRPIEDTTIDDWKNRFAGASVPLST